MINTMDTLRNVNQISFVFNIPTSKDKIADISKNINGRNFHSTMNSITNLYDSLKENNIPQNWTLIYDNRDTSGTMSFVKESANILNILTI
jgi:hypothetical protein